MKLRNLAKHGFVERLVKKREIAGADRMEYRLTKKGKEMTDKLIQQNIQVLEPIIKKLEKNGFSKKKELIEKILADYSEKTKENLREEELVNQIKKLEKILKKNLLE